MAYDILTDLRTALRPIRHKRRCSRVLRKIAEMVAHDPDWAGPVLYDIGARWGVSPPYNELLAIPGFRSVGFEPDVAEAEKLREMKAFTLVCPVALGARGEQRQLHIAQDPGSSSLHRPNPAEIARHTDWLLYKTVRDIDVNVEPMDSVIGKFQLPQPDYVKIDCEGAEGEVLEGAASTLSQICGLTFEARLCNFYLDKSATLSELLDRMFHGGFVCLRLDPVGSFAGSLVMFDVVMMRHPEFIKNRRELLLSVIFSLLHGNWLYAQRVVSKAGKLAENQLRDLLRA